MPRLIEPPDEYVETTIAVEDNERSQRSTDLPDPEPFRPQASPVDLSRGAPGRSKLAMLQGISQILESAVGTTRQGLQFFDDLQERTQAEERDEVGLAMRQAEVIEASPPGPVRRFFQGANPFIGQGRNEQFGENTRIRASAAFETALIAERQRRAELRERGQDAPSIETPEEVLTFAQDYFDTEMLNHELGRDPHFQRGFQEDLRGDLEAIIQREEVSRRERIVDEAHEAGAQLTRELTAAILDDVTDSVSPTALEEGTRTWIETNAAVGLGTKDELAAVVIASAGVDLLARVRRGQWADIGPQELGSIRSQLMSVAGADTENRSRVSDAIERVQTAIDTAQSDAAKADEASDDAYLEKLGRDLIVATQENDSPRARQIANEIALVSGDPGDGVKALDDALTLASSVGATTANEAAFNQVLEQMDLNGWTLKQVNRYARQLEELGNFAFTADQKSEFRIEQNRNQGRGRVRNDDSFKAARAELVTLIKQSGGGDLSDPLSDMFGGLSRSQLETADAYRGILRAFDQRVIAHAMDAGGIESIRSSPEWSRVLRAEADNALARIGNVAQASGAPDGAAKIERFNERLQSEQQGRDEATIREIRDANISEEEKVSATKAVHQIQKVERIIQAFPDEPDGTVPFMDPGVALAMNGVDNALDEFVRQQDLLETQIASLQGAVREIAKAPNATGSARALKPVQERLAQLQSALDEVNTEIASRTADADGETEIAAN